VPHPSFSLLLSSDGGDRCAMSHPGKGGGARLSGAFVVKALVSLSLLGWLAHRTDWANIHSRLAHAEPAWLGAAILAAFVCVLLVALRWRLLADVAGAEMTIGQAIHLTFVSQFFGQVLPASVGGDFIRTWLGWRIGLRLRPVLVSVATDRIVALLAMMPLVVISGLLLSGMVPPEIAWTPAASASALTLIMIGGLNADRLPWPAAIRRRALFVSVLLMVRSIRHMLVVRTAVRPGLMAVAVHLMVIGTMMLLARGLALPVSFFDCFLVVPVAVLASMLPISLNGWGVREQVMISGMGLVGVSPDEALAISVLFGLSFIISSLPGAAAWFFLDWNAHRAEKG